MRKEPFGRDQVAHMAKYGNASDGPKHMETFVDSVHQTGRESE